MRFFGRKTKSSKKDVDDLDDELFHSTTNDASKEDKKSLQFELSMIQKQITDAKEEHEEVLRQLMPAKWELLDKKEQIMRIKSEYEEISAKLTQAQIELDELRRKLNTSNDRNNYNAT